MTSHKEEKVRDYPALRKLDGAFVVNDDKNEYHRALARRKAEKASRDLARRVDNMERTLGMILELLQKEK